jgi:hypothetical protein
METGIMLFDDKQPGDRGLPRRKQPAFDYLNDSARRPAASIRELLEAWFRRDLDPAKLDLRGRFRSEKASNHLGAFFELYLHELLCSMGLEVQVYPDLSGERKTRPNFLALKDGRPCFYLEATRDGPAEDDTAEKARMDRVYDTLNDMQSPSFFLAIYLRGGPATPPPGKRLRRELEQCLAALDCPQTSFHSRVSGRTSNRYHNARGAENRPSFHRESGSCQSDQVRQARIPLCCRSECQRPV